MKCRFCHSKMESSGDRIADYGKPTQRVVARMFICKSCHSEQTFDLDSKLLDYDIFVPPYELNVDPQKPSFTIKYYPTPGSFAYKTVLRLNHIPKNLTPQLITVKRIKLFLLFS